LVQSDTQVATFRSNILLLASGQRSKPNEKKSRNREKKAWTTSMHGLKGNVTEELQYVGGRKEGR
jgi:hypothetical protein